MSDESTESPVQEQLQEQPEERPRRSLWTLLGILCAVAIVVLALLLLRGCVSGEGASRREGKTIVSLESAEPVPGIVSVWIEESASVDSAIGAAGISVDSVIDMGGGRYLIVVPEGSERSAADKIAGRPGVYDVGRVYEGASSD